jgi:hypothetical protein
MADIVQDGQARSLPKLRSNFTVHIIFPITDAAIMPHINSTGSVWVGERFAIRVTNNTPYSRSMVTAPVKRN